MKVFGMFVFAFFISMPFGHVQKVSAMSSGTVTATVQIRKPDTNNTPSSKLPLLLSEITMYRSLFLKVGVLK
jgi:hypothetical protein